MRTPRADLPEVLTGQLGAGERELELVGSLLDFYEGEGLLSDAGEAEPLFAACDRCRECWPPGIERLPADEAGVSVPWIGPGYGRSRVCVVAINGNKFGGLEATWWITKCDVEHRRGNDTCGGQPTSRHRFYSLSAKYLAAILRPRANVDPAASLDDATTADLWDQVAYLQAVKCSPNRGTRGSPSRTMKEKCPPRYLREEIRRLDPSRLLVIGKGIWSSVAGALELEPPDSPFAGRSSTNRTLGRRLDAFFVVHPGGPKYFPESVRQLAGLR